MRQVQEGIEGPKPSVTFDDRRAGAGSATGSPGSTGFVEYVDEEKVPVKVAVSISAARRRSSFEYRPGREGLST